MRGTTRPPWPISLSKLGDPYSPDLFHKWVSIQGLAQAQYPLWTQMAGGQAGERGGGGPAMWTGHLIRALPSTFLRL
jgi:hypothetical protein